MELTKLETLIHEDKPITSLYEAAISGSKTTLETLIHKDKLILYKVSLFSFTETPLHISALHGHLDFTKAILEKCPKMVLEQDAHKRLPLHLAAAEGHTQIVKALLNQDKSSCLVRDGEGRTPLHWAVIRGRVEVIQDLPLHLAAAEVPNQIVKALLDQDNSSCLVRDGEGRTPLHWAVIRGRVEVIQDLVAANSEFILEDLDGDTVFHLCVKYNRLEALKLLVKLINDYKIINMGNQDGNSVLHLAAMLKQLDTLRYLFSIPEIKAQVNSINGKGLTALELLDECPKDSKTKQIQDFLTNEGQDFLINEGAKKNWIQKIHNLVAHLDYDAKEIRGSIMIVATVIATMSFEAAMNPPGGVWQQDYIDGTTIGRCNETNKCEAGTSVLASMSPKRYDMYVSFNNLAFVASLSIVASMVGGFPLKKKRFVWVFALSINFTIVFLSLGYIFGVLMVTPSGKDKRIWLITLGIYGILILTLVVLAIIDFGRIAQWAKKKLGLN